MESHFESIRIYINLIFMLWRFVTYIMSLKINDFFSIYININEIIIHCLSILIFNNNFLDVIYYQFWNFILLISHVIIHMWFKSKKKVKDFLNKFTKFVSKCWTLMLLTETYFEHQIVFENSDYENSLFFCSYLKGLIDIN
jgi:hypothetical protein